MAMKLFVEATEAVNEAMDSLEERGDEASSSGTLHNPTPTEVVALVAEQAKEDVRRQEQEKRDQEAAERLVDAQTKEFEAQRVRLAEAKLQLNRLSSRGHLPAAADKKERVQKYVNDLPSRVSSTEKRSWMMDYVNNGELPVVSVRPQVFAENHASLL